MSLFGPAPFGRTGSWCGSGRKARICLEDAPDAAGRLLPRRALPSQAWASLGSTLEGGRARSIAAGFACGCALRVPFLALQAVVLILPLGDLGRRGPPMDCGSESFGGAAAALRRRCPALRARFRVVREIGVCSLRAYVPCLLSGVAAGRLPWRASPSG